MRTTRLAALGGAFICLTLPAFAQEVPLPFERPDRATLGGNAAETTAGEPEPEAAGPDSEPAAGAEDVPAGSGATGETAPEPLEREGNARAGVAEPGAGEAVPDEGSGGGEPLPNGQTESAPPEDEAGGAAPEGETGAEPEPLRIYQSACPAVILGLVEAELLPPIAEGECRAQSPLLVTAVRVGGRMVPLSSPATLSCEMAMSLPHWAEQVNGFLGARENTALAELLTGTSYMCRNRNNAAGGNISEHGFANGLDVTGFALVDGRRMTLPEGWTDPLSPEGRTLRFAHDAACATFATTLGPEANAEHADHLHLDMGCHGKACTARLCE